jgi:hypothetical protein
MLTVRIEEGPEDAAGTGVRIDELIAWVHAYRLTILTDYKLSSCELAGKAEVEGADVVLSARRAGLQLRCLEYEHRDA